MDRYEYFLQPREERCAIESGSHLIDLGPETFGFDVLPGKRKWRTWQEGKLRAINVVSLDDGQMGDDFRAIDANELLCADVPDYGQESTYFIER